MANDDPFLLEIRAAFLEIVDDESKKGLGIAEAS